MEQPMIKEVWVFSEHKNGELVETSLELICEGRRLADQLKAKLMVILLGHDIRQCAESAAGYGVDSVLLINHQRLADYHPEFYTSVLLNLMHVHHPGIFLFNASATGQDLATRIAANLKIHVASGCDKLHIGPGGHLHMTRLTHQNKVHATITLTGSGPKIVTATSGIAKIKKSAQSQDVNIICPDPSSWLNAETEKIKITGYIKADPKSMDICDAELIISGGKGAGDEKGFRLIEDLADALSASVAGSRVAVDNQWIGKEKQIGQSGKSVAPDMMISCGISGAGAHVFGMRNTKTLIAINTDKSAPIMKMADLGVVGDLNDILPELIKNLRDLKKEPHNGN